MNISEWIEQSKTVYKAHLDTKIKVVGIIGKDSPDHGKGDNINSYLRENVFSVATSEEETCSIQSHYSEDEQILFLVMNGVDDVANIRKCLSEKSAKNYFDALAESEIQQMRMLHFLFISCHFIIIFEQTSRIDLEFIRFLKKVNLQRMHLRKKVNQKLVTNGLRDIPFNNRIMTSGESEGRMVIPRVLLAFQRNNIRSDVSVGKKRELYEKLEKNLDNQFTDILKLYDLIDCGSSSLCQLNETIPCVHLLNPKIVKRDIISEMFDNLIAEIENTKAPISNLASNNSFVKFLEDNFRSEKNEISLENVIELMKTLQCILDGSIEEKSENTTQMQNFIRKIQSDHMEEARRLYTNDKRPGSSGRSRNTDKELGEPVKIRSKEEHKMRFNDATHYIESVVGVNSKEILSEMQAQCNALWHSDMRACESISMMGHPCVKKVHPTYGDPTAPESRWTAHDAANTLVSTCVCGRKQLIRKEPFSVKEANFDFYEQPDFKCCKQLWRYQFQLYTDDKEEKDDIMWADRESNSLRAAKKMAQQEDELADAMADLDLPESLQESSSSSAAAFSDFDLAEISSHPVQTISSQDSLSESEMFVRPSSRQEERIAASKTEHELAVEYAKKIQKLESSGKSEDYLTVVPNSITSGKLPIFPSFYLTALGDCSVYNHSTGLKNQPNFKIGGEHLCPTIVFLDVNADVWNRDLNKIRSEDFSRKCGKDTKDDVARVKLFVGFEYECSRGHRFFVDHKGEPFIFQRGTNVVKESALRASQGDILQADLPIRRPCTCRKTPLKSAQLQKIHVVTPKAPVYITIDPKILIPGHEGVYGTGQDPVELHHSKYYVFHLPAVYSGPSGTWIPNDYNPDREGTLLGGAIKVVYKPVLSFRW